MIISVSYSKQSFVKKFMVSSFLASNQNDDEFDKSNYYSLIVESYICKTGTVCGYVKKYGIRARDTFTYKCNKIKFEKNPNKIHIFDDVDGLVYFGFHDGLTGKPVGPIYKRLLGNR